jgi:lysophospholipase L1-like esterase
MRKIILFFLLLIPFLVRAQTFVERSGPAITVQDYRLGAKLNFYLPHTHGLTLNGGLDTLGAAIYEDSSGHVWYRDTVSSGGHKWSEVLKLGDVTPVIWGNITGTLSNQTDLQNALNTKLSNITGYIQAGTNVTLSGLGTLASPYVINSSASGTGTVTNFIFTNGNGLTGVVTNSTTTPSLQLGTSLNGIISGNGTGFSTVTIGSGLNYFGGVLTANGGTSLTGLVSANGSAFVVTNIGAGLSYVGTTLTNTINNTNQLTNGAGFLTNITGLISAGTNVSITGSGTSGSPYVINSSGGGGGGTVTTFSAGNANPLFTTSVTNPTTIPGLSFTLSNATANSVFGNNTGSSAAPVYYVPTITTLNGWASGTIALLGNTQTFTGNNTLNGITTFGAGVAFSTSNTYSIGGSTDVAAHMWSRVFNSDAAASLSSTTGNPVSLDIGTNAGITLLSTGQAEFNNYTGSGFSGTSSDSILTINPATGAIGWRWGQPFYIYPVQLLSGYGTHGDTVVMGGIAGQAFQNDSLYFGNNSWFIYNLNASFSTLVAGDSVMVHGSNGQVKYLPSSAIGGGGSQTFQQVLTTGSTLTGANTVTMGANNFTWSGTGTMAINSPLSTNSTVNLTGITTTSGTSSMDVMVMDTITARVWKQKYYPFDTAGYAEGSTILSFNGSQIGLSTSGGGGISQLFGKSPVAVSGTDTAYLDTTLLINPQYPYGYEYNKNYFADTLDFRNTANTTMSADTSMHLDIGNNGSTDSTGNVIKMVNATLLEKFVMTAQVIVTTAGKGFGLGLSGQNAAEPISLLGFVPTAGAPVGKASLSTASNGTTWVSQNVSGSGVSISAGDTITCVLTRADSVITFTVTQSAFKGGATSTATFTYNLSGTPLIPNTAYWGIWPMGGAYTVLNLSIYTATPKNATLMCEGDSKTQGYFQTYFADRWVNRINAASSTYQTVVAAGGGGDFTDQVIARLHEIKWLHPARVLLFIGSNDERNGRTLLQWETNYDYIANELTKAGIQVYHLLQTNETTLNFTAYNNHILQTFPASRIVNAGVIELYSDGIHPDSVGARQIADSVISQIGSQLFPIAPIIPAVRLTDILTSADSAASKTWPVNRIIKATSSGYPRQIPFGTNQQNFSLTGAQVSGGGLSQSAGLTFDSSTNILHIGNPTVGPNLTDLAGNGAFITSGFNPNASLQYIPTSTSAAAIYLSAGSIYWYQNTGLTVGTAFSIRNTFQATPGTSGATFTFNPSNSTAGFNSITSNGDVHVNGTLLVAPIAATANGTIQIGSNPATTAWQLLTAESTSQFIIHDLTDGTSPFAIASAAPTSSQNIFASGNIGFGTSTDVASALVQMVSTTKGFLPPAMTTTQRTAISSPANGLIVYDVTLSELFEYQNGAWVALVVAATPTFQQVLTAGSTMTSSNTVTLGSNNFTFSGSGIVYVNNVLDVEASSSTTIIGRHIQGSIPSSQPPSIAAGSGAGSSPTVSLTGGEQTGVINVTTGTLPTASATVVTVTYHSAFTTNTYPVLQPANAVTALLSGATMVYTTGTSTTFVITAGTTALTPATTYSWYYYIGAN